MKTAQQGVAVVLARGVVALAAIAAAVMLASQSTWARHAELSAEHAQAQALVQAGVDWARALLYDDRRLSSVDHLGEPWAMRLPPVPVDNGELVGQIDDQQGAFNLNNVFTGAAQNPLQVLQWRRLLEILGLPDALADAYLSTRRPLVDAAELALIPGFDADVRARLRPFVTALPRFTAINVNTASPEVLAAVIDGLKLDAARDLVAQRARAFFRNRADFLAQLPPGSTAAGNDIATSSEFFQAGIRVTIGAAQARGSALLERTSSGWPVVVWRKYP